jgi:hypothetical protein
VSAIRPGLRLILSDLLLVSPHMRADSVKDHRNEDGTVAKIGSKDSGKLESMG